VELCHELRRIGFDVPITDKYVGLHIDVVKTLQMDGRLTVDGKVGTRETWPLIDKTASQPVPVRDTTQRAARLSKALATLWDKKRWRMTPGYRGSDLDEWRALEAGKRDFFAIPLAADGSEEPGATCGHAAWLLTSWWLRAMNPVMGLYPTWRTGRGPKGAEFAHRFLPILPCVGEVMGGALHRGLKEYVFKKYRVADLCDLTQPEYDDLMWFYLQWDPGHVVQVVVASPTHGFIDPRTGISARFGAYRFAADGGSTTVGQPWTWKRVTNPDPKEWTAYGIVNLTDDGRPPFGPFKDMPDYELKIL
jgi:hypothetical protein